jgi:hypothetical protein
MPLRTAVQIGADEGFELAKATLCLHGHKLYSEVWNDQPPLHTWLITQVVKLRQSKPLTPSLSPLDGERVSAEERGYSILGPRLLTSAFTAVLLACVFSISCRISGLLIGTLTTAFLIASPGFLELSSSCMLEIPALATAIAGLCVLMVLPRTKWYAAECCAGVLFGLAALMKLVPLYLLPLAALVIWLRHRPSPILETTLSPPGGEGKGEGAPRPLSRTPRKAQESVRGSTALSTSSALYPQLRRLFVPLLVTGASLAASFVVVDWFIERGAFLIHFQQSWSSHFGGVQSFEFGSPKEHAFDWSILPKNWDLAVPALVGICLLIKQGWKGLPGSTILSPTGGEGRVRGQPATGRVMERANLIGAPGLLSLVPLTWLALSLIVFTNHKPWWDYYYIHIAIPLCWCAAIGVELTCRSLAQKLRARDGRRPALTRSPAHSLTLNQAGRAVPLLVFALCAAAWMGTRVCLQIAGVRQSPQLYAALVLKEIERLKPFTRWMYTDQIVYSFHADIPMPPPLAVVPLKRLWTGDMTRARIAAEMSRFKPEIILLSNDAQEVPFQHLLEGDYRLIYQDDRQRLYAERATIKRADAVESSSSNSQ